MGWTPSASDHHSIVESSDVSVHALEHEFLTHVLVEFPFKLVVSHEVILDFILHGQGLEGGREGEQGGPGEIGDPDHHPVRNFVKDLAVTVSTETLIHDHGVFLSDSPHLTQLLFLFSDRHEEANGDEGDDGK